MSKKEFKVKVAILFGYNGQGFHGLQKAKNVPTVESHLEEALHSAGFITDRNFGNLKKSGWSRGSRTDKGVHAAVNCISCKLSIPVSYVTEGFPTGEIWNHSVKLRFIEFMISLDLKFVFEPLNLSKTISSRISNIKGGG